MARLCSPCPSLEASDCGATTEYVSLAPSLSGDDLRTPTGDYFVPCDETEPMSERMPALDDRASEAGESMPTLMEEQTVSVAVHGVRSTSQIDDAVRFAKQAVSHDDPDSVHVVEEAHVFVSRIVLLKLAGYGVTAPSKTVRGRGMWVDRAHTEIRTPARSAVLNARYVAKGKGSVVPPSWRTVLSDFVAPLLRAMGGAAAGVVRVHQPRSPWNGKVRCGQVFISFRDEHSAEAALAAIRAGAPGSLDVGGICSSVAVSYFSADDKGAGQIGSGVSCSAADVLEAARFVLHQ